jgi:hypothetical protein
MGWGAGHAQIEWPEHGKTWEKKPAGPAELIPLAMAPAAGPVVSVAFYRKHTENMLRRYLYASMQVGRSPSILGDSVGRGWCSSRPVRTFEDAVIFVLDMERCLDQLEELDRQMLCRVVLQEYTQAETASLLGMSVRTICYKLPQAIDRLTEILLATGLLVIPN